MLYFLPILFSDCCSFYSWVKRLMIDLPIIFITTVTINSTSPNSINADKYTVFAASVNSFAITLAIVFPGANMLSGKMLVLPITIVTAIVSPNALPRDNNKPANKPDFVYGNVTYF